MATRGTIKVPVLWANQGTNELACFTMKAKTLWSIVSIDKRDPDKDKGYQRALSLTRVTSIKRYIERKNPIPNSVLVAFGNNTKISSDRSKLIIPKEKDAGWVIDGQHRLAGSHESSLDIELIVVAFIGLSLEKQIEQFVTINKEAKGVPTSLYYDLLKKLPKSKSESEMVKEKAADISTALRKNEESTFYGRIVVVTAPKKGELSLTNFVRVISPLLSKKQGKLAIYNTNQQINIIDNYFKALRNIFPQYFEEPEPLFFQTLGFGALINALPTVFDLTMTEHKTFTIGDISKVLKKIENFPFDDWKQYGTGSAAELQAGDDLRSTLLSQFDSSKTKGGLVL